MRILQINCIYGKGSTGKIVCDLHRNYLAQSFNSYVLYGRKQKTNEKNVFKISSELEAKIHKIKSILFGLDFARSPISTRRTILFIKKIKPDIVHLHCLNGYFINVYDLLCFLKKTRIKTILTLHAEIMHTAGCEHAMECEKWKTGCHDCKIVRGLISHFFVDDAKRAYSKMKNAFNGFQNLTVVGCSKWVMERAQESGIFRDVKCNYDFVHNDIDDNIFKYRNDTTLRKRLGISDTKKIVLNVTSNFSYYIKGPTYLIDIARRLPDYQFIVVGFNGWKEPLPRNIMTITHTENQDELAEYYSIADCFISTSIRETLPTVCLEASSCGCNVLAFDSGGAKETIIPGHGDVVTPYSVEEYVNKITYWVNQPRSLTMNKKQKSMAERYLEIYEKSS